MTRERDASPGSNVLARFAEAGARRSRLTIAIWLVVVGFLALQGRNLEQDLNFHTAFVNGSPSKRAHEIAVREFDNDNSMVIVLRGPPASVEGQGRTLVRRLEATPRMLVLSPWQSGGTIPGLRPSPRVAAMVVRVEGGEQETVSGVLPPVQRQVDAVVESPVRVSIAGYPVIAESIRSVSGRVSKIGELIGIPILLFVLLFVFRSVIAALIPVIVGGAVVAASRGLLSIFSGFVEIDLLAAGIVGMIGLALGVDYSLLVVSRFREERDGQTEASVTAARTARAAARSVIPAGCGLVLAMGAALLLIKSTAAISIAIAVSTAAMLSVVSAVCVVPALLNLLGDNLDRLSIASRTGTRAGPPGWSRRLASRPGAVIGILIVLVVLTGWAFNLNTATGSVAILPKGDPGRVQQEEVEEVLGAGWSAPMEVVVNGRGRPLTSDERLRALGVFQRRVERDPGVESMTGFKQIARLAGQADDLEGQLSEQERGLRQLDTGLVRLRRGANLNSTGLHQAALGAGQLNEGLGAANAGAGALAGGVQAVSSGSSRLTEGLGRVDDGSGKLAEGTSKASTGAGRLAEALGQASEETGEITGTARLFQNAMRSGKDRLGEVRGPLGTAEERLAAAWEALRRMTVGRSDPEYAAARSAVEEASLSLTGSPIGSGEPHDSSAGAMAGIERAEGQFDVGSYLATRLDASGRKASEGLEKLATASDRLDRGLERLADGSRRISDGVGQLSRGGERLSPALVRLSQGADRLTNGLGLLETGAGQLAGGLGTGADKSELLGEGVERIQAGLRGNDEEDGGAGFAELQRQSPGLFHSDYFVLAGLDGSKSPQRGQLSSLINLSHGGTHARMLVIPRDAPASDGARETKERLEEEVEDLARKTDAEVVVGGVTPLQFDIDEAFRSESPLLRLALSLISFLILVPVTRSLVIPAMAALINLLAVSASFGLVALLFNGSLLGGPGFVETTVVPLAMMVMFGLAIDYEVFIFARMREEYERTGSPHAAIDNGLDRTAHVITGAAIIMISVFLVFSITDFMLIRNFGIAQAVAVFIDAFIVRLVVVPAVMRRLGVWSWWIPKWLDRLLPGGSDSRRAAALHEPA
jgi:putative drug exporter of the RND superfamily